MQGRTKFHATIASTLKTINERTIKKYQLLYINRLIENTNQTDFKVYGNHFSFTCEKQNKPHVHIIWQCFHNSILHSDRETCRDYFLSPLSKVFGIPPTKILFRIHRIPSDMQGPYMTKDFGLDTALKYNKDILKDKTHHASFLY